MWEEQQPVVRITTFGPLSVECLEDNSERYTPISTDKIDAKGVLPARSLLKLLLCQPHRYAPRDWVLEQFWPDMEHKAALHRVGNVVWILRRMLCPPDAKEREKLRSLLLTSTQSEQSTGLGYQLAAYPLIWVDADAFEWNVEQAARASRFGDDPLPFWQRAYALGERGTFLQDEIYSDWTARRRHLLDGHFRQCVFEVSRLLIARGLSTEAEVCLRKYVVAHPTDEDVLRSLMELLGEQERYQELLGYYETCETALADEDRQPDSRTQDMAEYFKSKQIRRPATLSDQASSKPSTRQIFSPEQSLVGGQRDSSGLSRMNYSQDVSLMLRRQFLIEIFGLTQSLAFVPEFMPDVWMHHRHLPVFSIEEFLHQCEATITSCWQLMKGYEIIPVQSVLLTWLPPLENFLKQHLPEYKALASIAAQGYILAGLVTVLQQNDAAAEWCCKQALDYSRQAENPHLQVAAIKHLATKYSAKYPLLTLQTYQQALPLLDQVSPLLRSRTYLGLALASAQLKQKHEADHYLGLTRDHFPQCPEEDPSFSYADCGRSSLNHYQGLIYLEFNQPEAAWETFAEVEKLATKTLIPERTIIEIVICQAEAAVAQKNMDVACAHIRAGVAGALKLHSLMRFSDTHSVYEKMRQVWPYEEKVQQLEELFRQKDIGK